MSTGTIDETSNTRNIDLTRPNGGIASASGILARQTRTDGGAGEASKHGRSPKEDLGGAIAEQEGSRGCGVILFYMHRTGYKLCLQKSQQGEGNSIANL